MSSLTTKSRTRGLIAAMAGLAAAFCATASMAAADFTGFWVLQGDPMAAPPAPATPAAARRYKELSEARGLDAPNGSPEYARIWCTSEGLPYQTSHSLPFTVAQGPTAITVTYSIESVPRHIYLDGQPHPDLDAFVPNSVGHSTARWRGDTLVVATRYFKEGVLLIPGGGLRTDDSRLTERWRLTSPDTLQVTYTWTDPSTLRRPHTYTQTYARATGQVWMTEPQCNPVRAMRQKGLKVPFDAVD